MFNSITWQEFVTVVLGAALVYYLIITLLLFHKQIISKFANRNQSPSNPEEEQSQIQSNDANDLMGQVAKIDNSKKTVPHENIVKAEDITIQSGLPEETISGTAEEPTLNFQQENLAELLHDIETLARVLADSKPSQEESISMYQSLLSRYIQRISAADQEQVNNFISLHCKKLDLFDRRPEEIQTWWTNGQ